MSDKAVSSRYTARNPRTEKLEFFGVIGTTLLVPVIPIVIYGLYFACSEQMGGCPAPLFDLADYFAKNTKSTEWWWSLWDLEAFYVYAGWVAYCYFTWLILPGDWIEGLPTRDGTAVKYKINALTTFLLTCGLICGALVQGGASIFTFPYEHFLGLVTASLIFSFVQSIILYIVSFREGPLLALSGNSGYFMHDFWMGRELNPRIGGMDMKYFMDLRPSLIGWFLLNISMACEQAIRRGGSIFSVTDSMILVLAFEGWYVLDALYNEPAILSTMDITSDGLGYMLTVGNYSWVPFVFSLQARYLAWNHVELGPYRVAAILLVQGIGYWIFRSSNNEKNEFRKGNNPKNLAFMETKRGTRLITSGWWGLSQHPNYMGDLIMSVAWCLPTGFDTPITYFYVLYFTILLLHRQRRDDEACAKKYGDDWPEYKKRVPYRIFPYIY